MQRAVIALDVGGSKITSGVFLEDGETLFRNQQPTLQGSAAASVEQLASLVAQAHRTVPLSASLVAVGVAIPGWIHHRRHTVWAPNIIGWDHIPLQHMLESRMPAPLVVEADRSAYVAGETWLGAARNLSDVVFLAAGTGIGAGIMADGRIVHGHDDLAGAVGWMALNPQSQDSYVRMGCLEAEASGNSVGRKASLRAICAEKAGEVTANRVVEAAENGNAEACALLDEAAMYLGMGVANLVSILNPQMVVLGGGLFQSGNYLFERILREFVRWAQPFAAERVRLQRSQLGADAGLAGAARLAFLAIGATN